MIEKIGGRKFVFAILAVIMGFALVMVSKLDSEAFLRFAELIGGIYVVGNVVSKVADK